MTIGIIGLGSFGIFAARVLSEYAEVLAWDIHSATSQHAKSVELEEMAKQSDIVLLAVPLGAYREVLVAIQPHIRPETVVVDICSVKVKSRNEVLSVLTGHENILITHPLFGPESAATSMAGHALIVTDAVGERAERCVDFCEQTLGLQVTRISAEEHDKVMAYVHVLTFFVARGLGAMELPAMPFRTPSFNELVDLIELDKKHSPELFMTIQKGNPYAEEVRQEFIHSLANIEKSIGQQ